MTELKEKPAGEVRGPRKIWEGALRAVKGGGTEELVEQFTSEMTLVAEGLCEDQSRLRDAVQELQQNQTDTEQKLYSEVHALEREMEESRRDTDRQLKELSARLQAIERAVQQDQDRKEKKSRLPGGFMRQLTLIVGIAAGAWVVVTLLNLLRSVIAP